MSRTRGAGPYKSSCLGTIVIFCCVSLSQALSNNASAQSQLPIGTVVVCNEKVSAGVALEENTWSSYQFSKKTMIFKKVDGDKTRDSCHFLNKDQEDYFHDNGKPHILHVCYSVRNIESDRSSEQPCQEQYGEDGTLFIVHCQRGFSFNPEGAFYGWPNPAIFEGGMKPESYNVSHGNCSKM